MSIVSFRLFRQEGLKKIQGEGSQYKMLVMGVPSYAFLISSEFSFGLTAVTGGGEWASPGTPLKETLAVKTKQSAVYISFIDG